MDSFEIPRFAPYSIQLRALDAKEMEQRTRSAERTLRSLLAEVTEPLKLSIIQATTKSQVYAFEIGTKKLIGKFFEETADVEREVSSYMVWRGGPIPRLVRHNIKKRVLLVSRVKGKHFVSGKHSPMAVARGLGRLHLVAQENFRVLPESSRRTRTLGTIRASAKEPYARILEAWARIVGDEHIPVALGDLKPEHALIENDGCNFVDLETTSLGQLSLHDLLCLWNFLDDSIPFFCFWRANLAEQYLQASGLDARGVNVDSLTRVLRDYANLCRTSGLLVPPDS